MGASGGLSASGSALGYAAALGSAVCMAFYSLGSGRARVPALDAMLCGAVIGTLASAALVVGITETPDGVKKRNGSAQIVPAATLTDRAGNGAAATPQSTGSGSPLF